MKKRLVASLFVIWPLVTGCNSNEEITGGAALCGSWNAENFKPDELWGLESELETDDYIFSVGPASLQAHLLPSSHPAQGNYVSQIFFTYLVNDKTTSTTHKRAYVITESGSWRLTDKDTIENIRHNISFLPESITPSQEELHKAMADVMIKASTDRNIKKMQETFEHLFGEDLEDSLDEDKKETDDEVVSFSEIAKAELTKKLIYKQLDDMVAKVVKQMQESDTNEFANIVAMGDNVLFLEYTDRSDDGELSTYRIEYKRTGEDSSSEPDIGM